MILLLAPTTRQLREWVESHGLEGVRKRGRLAMVNVSHEEARHCCFSGMHAKALVFLKLEGCETSPHWAHISQGLKATGFQEADPGSISLFLKALT